MSSITFCSVKKKDFSHLVTRRCMFVFHELFQLQLIIYYIISIITVVSTLPSNIFQHIKLLHSLVTQMAFLIMLYNVRRRSRANFNANFKAQFILCNILKVIIMSLAESARYMQTIMVFLALSHMLGYFLYGHVRQHHSIAS